MTAMSVTQGTARVLSGPAYDRGLGQSDGDPALAAQVRRATVGRVEQALSEGWLDKAMRDYVTAQRRYAEQHDPDGMAELAGIAEGFGLPEEALFLHLHLGTLRDFAAGAMIAMDGCSAWAVGSGPDGPLLVKNRDFGGIHLGVQRLTWHAGPDIITGGMVCLGSLGSPGAYSSGMNAAGLALADTQIGARHHGVGWLRYFLMTRILARCKTVEEALAFITSVPHAGGGSLILADRSGATASVELGARCVAISRGAFSCRTNHFVSAELRTETLRSSGDRISANSEVRLACLAVTLPTKAWGIDAAASLMARHTEDPNGAPICQHPSADDDTSTLSSVIYAIDRGCVYWTQGNPCAGRWQQILPPT